MKWATAHRDAADVINMGVPSSAATLVRFNASSNNQVIEADRTAPCIRNHSCGATFRWFYNRYVDRRLLPLAQIRRPTAEMTTRSLWIAYLVAVWMLVKFPFGFLLFIGGCCIHWALTFRKKPHQSIRRKIQPDILQVGR